MSKLKIVAENRSEAPALFVLDVFSEEPEVNDFILDLPGYDPTSDTNFLWRCEHNEMTDPGRGIMLDINVNYDADVNELGPKLWFRMPKALRKRFFLRKVIWNGINMLTKTGWV